MFKKSVFILGVLIFSLGSFAANKTGRVFVPVSQVYKINNGSSQVEVEEKPEAKAAAESFTATNIAIGVAVAAIVATSTYFIWKKYSGRLRTDNFGGVDTSGVIAAALQAAVVLQDSPYKHTRSHYRN